MGDSPIGTTKNIVIPLGTVYANRTTWVRAESAKKSCKKRVFSPSILMVHLIHVGNEVQQLVGIAPLVVIPGDELYKVVVQHDARRLIEDTGLGEAGQVRGNHLVPGAGDDALHAVLGGVLHGHAHIMIGGGLDEPGRQVHHRHVVGGHPEAHTGHLALQLRDDLAHSLGSAGGRGNDIAQDAAAGAPIPAGPGIHRLLFGRGGVNGGHQGLLDAEGIMDNLGHRRQTVGGAGGVGHHVHIRGVLLMVHAHDESGRAVVLGRGRDDDLLRAMGQVHGRLFRGVVNAGGFDDVLRAAVVPVELSRIALTVYPNFLPVDDQIFAVMFHAALERPKHGVVFYLVDHVVQVRVPQVDTADLIAVAAPLHHDPQRHTPDSAEAVDTHFNSHDSVPFHIFILPVSRPVLISL